MAVIEKKYQGVAWLVAIILLMSILKLKYGQTPSSLKPAENNKLISTPTASIANTTQTDDFPLQKYLPYKGRTFLAEKYVAPRTLQMTMLSKDTTLANKEVNEWLATFGEAGAHHKWTFEK